MARHSYVNNQLERGVDKYTISKAIGHANGDDSFNNYAKTSNKDLIESQSQHLFSTYNF